MTGHSLGGALATMAAMDIRLDFPMIPLDKITFYTFGSPRTGNRAFTDFLFSLFPNGGNQRVTHFNDSVPHVPPYDLGYSHVGDEVWYYSIIYSNLSYKVCYNSAGKKEDFSCSGSYLDTGIAAHLNYLNHQVNGMCKIFLDFDTDNNGEEPFLN